MKLTEKQYNDLLDKDRCVVNGKYELGKKTMFLCSGQDSIGVTPSKWIKDGDNYKTLLKLHEDEKD